MAPHIRIVPCPEEYVAKVKATFTKAYGQCCVLQNTDIVMIPDGFKLGLDLIVSIRQAIHPFIPNPPPDRLARLQFFLKGYIHTTPWTK